MATDKCKLGPVLQKALHRKLLMLLQAQDWACYRVMLNLQTVLLRGFMVPPVDAIIPADPKTSSELDVATHAVSEFLHQNGFGTVHEVDSCGWSPMHYAALRGEPLLIQSILELRAYPDLQTKKIHGKHGALKGVVPLDICLS